MTLGTRSRPLRTGAIERLVMHEVRVESYKTVPTTGRRWPRRLAREALDDLAAPVVAQVRQNPAMLSGLSVGTIVSGVSRVLG
jgi:hypothetical protein